MKLKSVVVPLLLASGLLAGCSKHAAAVVTNPKQSDLGTVELSPGQAVHQDLGDGMSCDITGTPLDAASLQIIAVAFQNGKPIGTNRVVPAPVDKPLDMSFGNVQVRFTPHLK